MDEQQELRDIELRDIQEKIDRLRQRQYEIIDRASAACVEEVRRLGWLRGKTVKFVHSMVDDGSHEFRLQLQEEIPLLEQALGRTGHVCLYSSRSTRGNVVLFRNNLGLEGYSMETRDARSLCQFVVENDLKVELPESHRMVYRLLLSRLPA